MECCFCKKDIPFGERVRTIRLHDTTEAMQTTESFGSTYYSHLDCFSAACSIVTAIRTIARNHGTLVRERKV